MATCVIDTEYNPDTQVIYWVGMTFDGVNVWGMPWTYEYMQVVKEVCEDAQVTKVFHNALADVRVLNRAGILVNGSVIDTMLAYYCLYPEFSRTAVGLDDMGRHLLEDVAQWKHMPHDDPNYNAKDVLYTWHSLVAMRRECERRPVNPWPEIEARCALLPVVKVMEERGIYVDTLTRDKLVMLNLNEADALTIEVRKLVAPLWDAWVREHAEGADRDAISVQGLKRKFQGSCSKHPKFGGIRTKPPKCERCRVVWAEANELRAQYAEQRKRLTSRKGKITKWKEGFNPESSSHLKWLLYDELRLPKQFNKDSRNLTTGARAIEHLLGLKAVKDKPEKYASISKIKRVQECRKAVSTFLQVGVSGGKLCYPNLSYKIHGTETGRLAGGDDKGGDEDKYHGGHSLMNIPEKWRVIYVAPHGQVFIYADHKNQEGRATAWLSKDAAYTAAFKLEEAGGPSVHAQTAALLFNIDPKDAKLARVRLNGTERSAYWVGKMARHAWSYNYIPVSTLMYTLGFSLSEAVRVDDTLSQQHRTLVGYKRTLVGQVLGEWEVDLAGPKGVARAVCVVPGRRYYANPFGWQRYFYGMGKVVKDPVSGKKVAVPTQANDVLALGPQSLGASICARLLPEVEAEYPIQVTNYDSVMVACKRDTVAVRECVEFMRARMEQPWAELNGYSFKVELKVGENWGERSDDNPYGLEVYE